MKKTLLLTVLCVHQYAFAQSNADLKIIDLSQTELRLLNKGKELDSITRSKIYLDSLYMPYKQFWSGYAGKEKDFLSWMNKEGVVFLDYLNQRNKDINGGKLLAQFNEVEDSMIKLTGYTPKGTWYIVYYHGSTNLGGLGSGEMLIDLSHENNSSNENIMAFFPHELAHQIMSNINKHKDSTAISWIIGEGFAVYMNELYWGKKYTLAQNLGFTEDELKQCGKSEKTIKQFFKRNKFSTNKEIINKFRSRSEIITPGLPGAIGYYIGYQIIKKYAKKFFWKSVFTKSPQDIYKLSGY